ncbi:hypothetical protein CQ018_16540 [Arthrobacter sp. MYb227]|uniref:hypothetical protein n=1 Tax=Arthrobacter sp. MYb227 TaxID=1848601 RepID=UPI000CFDD805|nr:hypothetical protein [Arthrobacter sp. MYb227]PQZ88600.1 hypothetical protein CQ018_16540 [Arthrobacter sp. MYb227]
MNQPEVHQPASPARRPRPFSVLLISAMLVLEGLAVLAYGLSYAMHLGDAGVLNLGARLFMLVIIFVGGIWQLTVAHFFFRGKAWTRAAALFWQLFQIILAIPYLQTEAAPWAWIWLIPAAIIVILLFDPRTTAFLGDRPAAAKGANEHNNDGKTGGKNRK